MSRDNRSSAECVLYRKGLGELTWLRNIFRAVKHDPEFIRLSHLHKGGLLHKEGAVIGSSSSRDKWYIGCPEQSERAEDHVVWLFSWESR